jgi:hypothetical protein
MLRWILFETRIGNWLLTQLEQRAGLAVIEASELTETEVGGTLYLWATAGE